MGKTEEPPKPALGQQCDKDPGAEEPPGRGNNPWNKQVESDNRVSYKREAHRNSFHLHSFCVFIAIEW